MKRLAVVTSAMLAALVAASAAAADVSISGVDASGYPEIRLTVVAPVGGGKPQLAENGRPVAGVQAVSLAAAKRVVLAVDRSRSMAGGALADATAAARAFVAAKNTADDVEVIAFGHNAATLGPFANSVKAASSAVDRITLDRTSGTALWDAVVLAARGFGDSARGEGRVIVVVTDGGDVSSASSLAQAVAAARGVHAAVYAVGIASLGFTPEPLRKLAAETGGAYLQAASSTQLVALYRSIGRSLARTWQLRYATNARPGDHLQLVAAVAGHGSGERLVALAGDSSAQEQAPSLLPRSAWRSKLGPLVLSGAVGLLVLVAALFALTLRRRSWLAARLEPHLGQPQRRTAARHRSDLRDLPKRLFGATERTFANVKQFRTLQALLARADLPLQAAELVYICLGSTIVVVAVTALAGAPTLVILLLGWVGAFLPILFVILKARARINAFDDQLPDLLTTIAASLKAGHSFRHAIQSVVDEGADPAAKEFRQVLTETRLGRPMDIALTELSERTGSKNLTFALTAVTIQRQIGGSLAGLFDMVAETVRQRQQFARKIRALTAMGRMSAYVLIALPFMVALVVTAINSAYMAPLWSTSTGHQLILAGLTMIAIGSLVLRKIVSFRG